MSVQACAHVCVCVCLCVCVFIYACAHAHVCMCLWAYKVHAWVCMWGHLHAQSTCECMCVWRTLGKVIWKHHQLQHTSLTLYLLPAGTTLLRRAGAGDDHLTHLADIWTWNNTNTSPSASCPWQLWFTQHNHHSLLTGPSLHINTSLA